MKWIAAFGVLALFWALGCTRGDDDPLCTNGCGQPVHVDLPDLDSPDSGPAPNVDASYENGEAIMPCRTSHDCAGEDVCLGGLCQLDPCGAASADLCAEGESCRAGCVPVSDRCADIDCPAGQTCVNGTCIDGCFPPSPCLGVVCAEGEFCSRASGTCVPVVPCSGACPEDTLCHLECAPPNPCDGVVCPEGQVCANGSCMNDRCAGVICPLPDQICINGACLSTCQCVDVCPDYCVLGTCMCQPECDPNAVCGSPDPAGCIPQCAGTCPEGALCLGSSTGIECCAPHCDPSEPCGSSDGCFAKCIGTCSDPADTCWIDWYGEGQCVSCVPSCPRGVECGSPDGCGGECPGSCGDEFSYCRDSTGRSGFECACSPRCTECGGDDGCGGVCMYGECPGGEFCTGGTCHTPPEACSPSCGCGQECISHTCVPLCNATETLCGCNRCCSGDEVCVGGECMIIGLM